MNELGTGTGLLKAVARHVLPAILLVYVFLILFVPLADPDLFWHLKTGQWTLDKWELPGHEDPFSYTSPRIIPEGQTQGMRSQWLGQVVLYAVYWLGGYPGLIVFRNLFIILPFFLAYVLAVRRGVHPLWVLSVVSLPLLLIALSLPHTFERPQAFTFLFSSLLVPLLVRLRRPGNRWPWTLALALMMALWSNLHGGFIFGVVIIAAFTMGALMEAAFRRKREGLSILMPAALGIAASLLNPNTYHLLYGFLRGHIARFMGGPPAAGGAPTGGIDVVGAISEYKPLLFFYREYHYVWPLFMAAFIGLAAAAVLAKYIRHRRVELPEAITLALFSVFGLYYARGITVCLVALPVFLLYSMKELRKVQAALFGGVALVLTLALVFVTLQRTPWQLTPSAPDRWVRGVYPDGAVRFIKDNNIKGPMFNELMWGGYLILRLYPEYRVFMDTRYVSNAAFGSYAMIAGAGPGSMRELDALGVNFILIQVTSPESGGISSMVLRFLEEGAGGWRLVHLEGNAALFLRDTVANREIIKRHGLPLVFLYRPILSGAEGMLAYTPGNPTALLSKAIALSGLGRHEEAERILRALPPSPMKDRYLRRG